MKMIERYAELFEMVCKQFDGADLGKKVIQKMFYFFERKGIQLNLRYGIHYYGPYSAKLDNTMHILESEDYISIDTSGTTHIISMGNISVENEALTFEEKEIAASVIETFAHKSPLELEALATMDYVANTILENASKTDIIIAFKKIKGDKFSDSMIDKTFNELKEMKLIVA